MSSLQLGWSTFFKYDSLYHQQDLFNDSRQARFFTKCTVQDHFVLRKSIRKVEKLIADEWINTDLTFEVSLVFKQGFAQAFFLKDSYSNEIRPSWVKEYLL